MAKVETRIPIIRTAPKGESLFAPVDQADTFIEKAVLTTLIILDKASFISPFRWFVGITATDDGQGLTSMGLMGCGDHPPVLQSIGDKTVIRGALSTFQVEHTDVSPTAWIGSTPDLVWTGNQYGIAWSTYDADSDDGTYFVRLDSNGNKIGNIINVSPYPNSPSLTWNGNEYAIGLEGGSSVWPEMCFDEPQFIRINASGNQIGSLLPVDHIPVECTPLSGGHVELLWANDSYGLLSRSFWQSSWVLKNFLNRLDISGNRIGNAINVINDYSSALNNFVTWNGNAYGIVWGENSDEGLQLYFNHFDQAGHKIGADKQITHREDVYGITGLVWNGNGYGVIWMDETGSSYFVRLDSDGNKMSQDVALQDLQRFGSASFAWNENEYGVVFANDHFLNFMRLDSNGYKLGGAIPIADANLEEVKFSRPVWSGSNYAVAWSTSALHFSRIIGNFSH